MTCIQRTKSRKAELRVPFNCVATLGVAKHGAIAQLGEHLLCKQGVVGSIPTGSTIAGNVVTTGL